jgi:hypothetical protein
MANKTEELRLILCNTEFEARDISQSDMETFYLECSGLEKILKACKEAGLKFVTSNCEGCTNKLEDDYGLLCAMICLDQTAIGEIEID